MIFNEDQTRDLVRRIVDAVHPRRIILFGSAARGDAHSRSDIDILVEVTDGIHRRRTAQTIYRALAGYGIPVDIVVATETDMRMYGDTPGYVYREVVREGKILYAA